eukprot:9480231-Pyramimonas_sp.AAC.1
MGHGAWRRRVCLAAGRDGEPPAIAHGCPDGAGEGERGAGGAGRRREGGQEDKRRHHGGAPGAQAADLGGGRKDAARGEREYTAPISSRPRRRPRGYSER